MVFKNKKYLDKGLSQGFLSLYIGKMIIQLASGIGSLFLPIFLYKVYSFNFSYVIYFYIINNLAYLFLVPYGAKFLNKFGFRKSLRLSVIFGALFYGSFYFVNEDNIYYLIIVPLVALTFLRMTYWLPYHVDFAKFTDKKNRGRQFSILQATLLLISVVSPLIFGFLVDRFNFKAMFIGGAIIYLLSGIAYFSIPRTREKFAWKYFQSWKEFFSKKNRGTVLAYIGDGAEGIVGTIVWPIFIWELLNGDFLQVGIISTLIIGVSVVLQLVFGKYTDKMNKKKLLRWGSFLYSAGWLAKIFAVTAFQIFITATYHNLSSIFFRTPFDVLTYEIAADEGHYVDEFTVLHEIAIGVGRVLMLVFILILVLFLGLSIEWTFILAALSSLLVNFLEFRRLR